VVLSGIAVSPLGINKSKQTLHPIKTSIERMPLTLLFLRAPYKINNPVKIKTCMIVGSITPNHKNVLLL
jgi:hypothetical protein